MQPENAETLGRSSDAPPDDDLIARMNEIRNSSERHVVRMHAEAERLVDWREHVRSHPLMAVGVAAAAGFFMVYRSRGTAETKVNEAATRSSIASGAMAFVGTMAGNMLKQYAANYVKGKLAGVHHDRNTDQQSEVHRTHTGQTSGRW